jgi:hypothetical protein
VDIQQPLYEGLRDGWLTLDDLGPALVGVQVWLSLDEPCPLHPEGEGRCRGVVVHEFASDGTSTRYRPCGPGAPAGEAGALVRAVWVLWADGRAQQLGPAELSYLHPVVARRRP